MSNPTIQRGSQGHWVTYLQDYLRWLGHYHASVDGWFGELTDTATREYQLRVGLVDDGIVGPITWASLEGQGDPTSWAGATASDTSGAANTGDAEVSARPTPADVDGDVEVVDSSGRVLGYGWKRDITRDGGISNADGASGLLLGALIEGSTSPPLDRLPSDLLASVRSLVEAVRAMNGTGALGAHVDMGMFVGFSGGLGFYYNEPSGDYGWYDSWGHDLGLITGGSSSIQLTLVAGDPSNLAGDCTAVVFGTGLMPGVNAGPVGGFSVLFTPRWEFLGIGLSVGGGISVAPIDLYLQFSNTRIRPLGTIG